MAPAARLPQPTVLTAWTGTLLRALSDRGIDGEALAAAAGIPLDALRDPARRIPLDRSTELWAAAVGATGDPNLGLEVSRYVRPGTFHTLGHAVLTSPTLREALERIARFSQVTADIALATTDATDRFITLTITWRPGSERPAYEAVDAIVASIVRTARFMLDRSVSPVAVALERPRPSDPEQFQRVFACPVAFDAPDNRLTFDAATADRPVAGANRELARLHDDVTQAYLARLEPDTAARRVRHVLPALLPGGDPTIASVAAAMATSPRTLQRQLQDEGTTFREVMRQTREVLAVEYLRSGEHSVTEVTYLLGFSETPTFSRAFKQWTGVAPSRFCSPPDGAGHLPRRHVQAVPDSDGGDAQDE